MTTLPQLQEVIDKIKTLIVKYPDKSLEELKEFICIQMVNQLYLLSGGDHSTAG